MKTGFTRALSGVAALGIALSGLALGVNGAYAADADAVSASIAKNATGTITISGGIVAHSFNGYRLGYLDSITYAADATDTLTGYTLKTDAKYTTVIENALSGITDNDTDLKTSFQNDPAYCGNDCAAGVTGTGEANPLGWFFEKYGSNAETTAPWGGGNGSSDSVLRQFATKVSAAVKADSTLAADATTLTSGDTPNSVPQGYYLLRDTTDLADPAAGETDGNKETQSAPILVSTTYTASDKTFTKDSRGKALGTIDLKNSTPKIAKQVVKSDGTTSQDQPDYAIGDTVTYELTSTVPYFTGYDIDNTYGTQNDADAAKARAYNIIDTASKGLTIDTTKDSAGKTPAVASVKITLGSKSVTLTEGKDYDVTSSTVDYNGKNVGDEGYSADATRTVIDLGKYVNMVAGSTSAEKTDGKVNGVLEGGTVTVVFKATLNKDALVSDPGNLQKNPNKVELEYSNKPEDMSSKHKTPGDEVNVYTYRFQLKKTDKGGKALPGAKFTVKVVKGVTDADTDNEHAGQYLAVKDQDGKDQDGKWTYTNDKNEAFQFTSDKNGIVSGLTGLDSGTYEVTETKAPSGYTQAFLPTFQFTITPAAQSNGKNAFEQTGLYTISAVSFTDKDSLSGTGAAYVTAAGRADGGIYQYTVYNAKNLTELPKTGGAGLIMFAVVAVLLLAAAGVFTIRSRRDAAQA